VDDDFPLILGTAGALGEAVACEVNVGAVGTFEDGGASSGEGSSSPNILALASAYAFSLSLISTVDLSVSDFLSILDPDVFRFITLIFPGAGAAAAIDGFRDD
jgi:hypothetical protein